MSAFRIIYHIGFLLSFLNGILASNSVAMPLKIIIHMGAGSRSHIKGVLEISSILSQRNHSIMYASLEQNEKFSEGYPFPFKSLGSIPNLNLDFKTIFEKFLNGTGSQTKIPHSLILKGFSNTMASTYETVYPTLRELVKLEKPDVMVCDFYSPACRDVAELHDIPFVAGFQTIDGFGVTNIPFITPDNGYGPITINEQTFMERFVDKVGLPLNNIRRYSSIIERLNKIRERYGVPPSTNVFGDLKRNLGLANTFEGFEPVMPLPPNIKVIGPVFPDSVTELESNLSTFLDSHHRILYIAFGSKSFLSKPELEKIMESILKLIENNTIDGVVWGLGLTRMNDFPETFSFRGSKVLTVDLFSGNLPQLRLLLWAPQVPILNHQNVKLFLSHGGLESLLESIDAGKPILAMGLIGDQPRNARKLENIGIGQYVDRSTFTTESLTSQVVMMMDDKDNLISSNVQRLKVASKFSSRRKYLAADLIEGYTYTAKACRPSQPHKWGEVPCEAKHLVPISHHMSFIKANLLDVYFAAFSIALVSFGLTLFVFFKVITGLYNKFAPRPTHPKSD